MRDWSDTFIVVLAASAVFALGICLGYSYGTKGMDELKAEKAEAQERIVKQERESYEIYAKQQGQIEELATQRDECRRIAGVRENRTTQK